MNAIELSHVTKHFPGFTLQDLSLTVPSGTICGLVGENGAGKSTTIRLLMGALRPDGGTVKDFGRAVSEAEPDFKEDIGVVLDEAYFPESLNALQVGGVMAKTYRRWDGKQYQNYLTRFGLPEKKPFKDFSRGMKMKLAIAVALGFTPLYFSIPVVILAAFFLLRLATNPRWNSDAAIAVMSASALAVGIIVISRTSGMTTDVDNYMFGSVLAMTWADVALSAVLSLAVLALFVLFYHKLFAVTFDESFSQATGLRVDWYNTLLAILTALTIVLGMRMMGAMLISSLVIFPALTAMRLFKSFRGVVVCAAVTSVCCFCAGLMASWTLSTPVGASVVAANLALFLLSCAAGWLRRR